METFYSLFEAAQAKGFRVEAYSTYFDRWGERTNRDTVISIEIQEYVWYTWEFWLPWFSNEEPYSNFVGRYNQTNGAKQKTWKKEHNALVDLGLETIKF